ncbi:MAG: AMP-binding protein [Candidatus Algichlamydia australiensis]|nr:AMP-binding protein [Chlamydiales bacterium]
MESIRYFIETLWQEYGDNTAIISYHRFKRREYTYTEIYSLIKKCAAYLQSKGLKKGDKILIYAENSPEWVVILLSCALSGIVLVPIDRKSPINFAKAIFDRTEAKWLVSDLQQNAITADCIPIETLFATIASFSGDSLKEVTIVADDLLEIVFTSGTTSEPKGVVITHRNFVASIQGIRMQNLSCNNYCRFLSMLPLSHVLEQNAGCLSILRFGGQIVYTRGLSFTRIVEVMREEKISHIIAVPAILEQFASKIQKEIEKKRLKKVFSILFKILKIAPQTVRRALLFGIRRKFGKNLQTFICGGAPLDQEVELFWKGMGVDVLQGYGLTESSAMCCVNTYAKSKRGAVGIPLPNLSLKIDKNGEILLKGDSIINEYYRNEKLNKEAFTEGWFHTGDVGRIDKKGFLYITGRLKDMILTSNGLNVFPTDIEKVMTRIPGIVEGAVFEDPKAKGKLVAAVIVDDQYREQSALEQVNTQLAPHQKLAKMVEWSRSSLPKTPSMKLNRKELAKIYLEELLQISKKTSQEIDPLVQILSQISQVPEEKIKHNSLIVKDLGLDSLSLVELVLALEARFRIEIDESILTQNLTLFELKKILTSDKQKRPMKSACYIYSKFFRWINRIFRSLTIKILSMRVKVEVIGELPALKRPTIFVANHTSHLDTYSIISAVSEEVQNHLVAAAAHDYFFEKHKIRGFFLTLFLLPLIPFYRSGKFSQNLKMMSKAMGKKNHLLLFPEGTRSRTGEMGRFKKGIGMVVKEMDAHVIPLYIEGAHLLLPPQSAIPQKGKIKVHIGEKLSFEPSLSAEEITSCLKKSLLKFKLQP